MSSSLSQESLQRKPKQNDIVLSPGWMALPKASLDVKGVVEEVKTTEYSSSPFGPSDHGASMQLSSNPAANSRRHRYSKTELEIHSANAKLPMDCTESSLEILGNLRRSDKSPSGRQKNGPSFDSGHTHSYSWQRGSFLSGGDHRESSGTFRHFPRKDEAPKRRQHKEGEVARALDMKPRFSRNQRQFSGSKKLLSEVWYYRDPQNEIQGPFSLIQLRQWLEAGYYDGSLPVCESGSDIFQSLESVLKRIRADDAPPGIGKKREDIIKDAVTSLDKSKSEVVKLDSVKDELQQSCIGKDEMGSRSSATSHNESQTQDQSMLLTSSTTQSKDGQHSRNNDFQKSLKQADNSEQYTDNEKMQKEELHEIAEKTCQLIFGNDISAHIESDTKELQENFPLERDIAELERDLVSKLDLDTGVCSSDNNSTSFADSSITAEKHRRYHRLDYDEAEKLSETSQRPPMNPAEYLMSIDPAVTKASVKGKSSSLGKNEKYSTAFGSNIQTSEQKDPYKVQNLGETARNYLSQRITDTNVRLTEPSESSYHTAGLNTINRETTEMNEDRNSFQEVKKTNGKKKRSHIKPSSIAAEASHESSAVNSKKSLGLGKQSSHEGKPQKKTQVQTISRSQEQIPSDSWSANTKAFDGFFKALSDTSKPAWNSWSRSASHSHYPLSLREVQLEEERRQKEEETLKADKERKMEGSTVKRFTPWERQPIESAPFADIQKSELEQALRSKNNSHLEDNRSKRQSGTSWSDKVAGSTSVYDSQMISSSVEKFEQVINSKTTSFWDYIDQSLGSRKPKLQNNLSSSSAKPSVDKYESFAAVKNDSFGATIPEDLRKWCEEQFSELLGSRDVTLAEFLASLKSTEEIREYAIIYLGSSRKTNDFVEEFVRRLEFESESQRVASGSSGSQTPKSGRRKKKS